MTHIEKTAYSVVNRIPAWVVLLIGTTAIVGIGILDSYAAGSWGYDSVITLLYLIPIVFAAWVHDASGAFILVLLASTFSSVNSFYVVPAIRPLELFFGEGSRIISFSATAFFVSKMRYHLELERLTSRTDYLTAVGNRRAFYEVLEREIQRSQRDKRPLSVAIFDIDNFKDINDTFGHIAGDEVLKIVASVLKEYVRLIDFPARLGGDEFAVLLPNTDEKTSRVVIARIREKIYERLVVEGRPATISLGLAVFTSPPDSSDALVDATDRLMMDVKSNGKNSIRQVVY